MKINKINTYTSNSAIQEVVKSVVKDNSYETFQVKLTEVYGNPVEIKLWLSINDNSFQKDLEILERKIIEELEVVFGENDYEIMFAIKNMIK